VVWGLGIAPNPQYPIPNPQSPIPNPQLKNNKFQFFYLNKIIYLILSYSLFKKFFQFL